MSAAPPPPAPGIGATTGNTPLVRFPTFCPRAGVRAWAKLEGFNPGGSAKDRTAAALLEDATAAGRVRPGGSVVESSSGNLGAALARECLLRDIDFHCVVDPRANRQTVAVMEALGATVHRVTSPDPETGDWLVARRRRVADLLRTHPGSVNLDQYSNRAAFRAHAEGTMREVTEQLGHAPDHLFVAVSTTGTLGGCLRHLRSIGAHTRVTAVDAEGSVLYGGQRGDRALPGFGAGVVPDLAGDTDPDTVVRVGAARSIAGARRVARTEGYLPGASGGAVAAAFLGAVDGFGEGDDAVLILHDQGNAYLDTVYDDDWVRATVCDPDELEDLL
ncbi:pyridoxal-phosphate dependent enzyme [Corynebacterium bovis]|uniref:2,3-diaminopropionate biosynthesis protein SbnA n=1 Tax=Corynebacterium bovis TaxID=36808 RepID=A0A426Q2J0_9CORY|nr:pyridoxal-phosphate dependent enzyme [Corynebacterium bovis]RRO89099.1 2,3-diaminopropionate biosynthesis protein SbnA [Corynebacterium bovis]RRO93519.1 2,3-diaminopropionate biosynthesis protein SbnA [Corynebacterium bovis]RRO93747.1 2,3-diaminopropionate biosynthesis protein SbnA [Corynebacterium bovis]RRO99980.1 2,3-diaminopropionate biosynthesis protein SbnA [Corynebacterium bovis]RRQ02323.1 2,3-diaminopropionate biosynthesis protein SbnA [Corynebacterium bovis]